MEKALFGLTIMGMKSHEEDVAKLAVEFWCTVCEEEISIEDDNEMVRGIDLNLMDDRRALTTLIRPDQKVLQS